MRRFGTAARATHYVFRHSDVLLCADRTMASAKYCIDQARLLLAWARVTSDRAYARALRRKAARLLAEANEAHAAVSDLNPLLTYFNDRQMRGPKPDGGAGA